MRHEVATFHPLNCRRITVNLMARRRCRGIGGAGRACAFPTEVGKDTRNECCERHKGKHSAFAEAANLTIRLRPVRRDNFNWANAAPAKNLKDLVAALGIE